MGKEKSLAWVKEKKEELETKRKQALKDKGYTELFNMPIGETEITIDATVEPRTVKTKYGDRDILRLITKNNESKDWMINPNSPLYLAILSAIFDGKTHMVIVRSGLEKQTRYSIKSVW